jgi:hypothetical protein
MGWGTFGMGRGQKEKQLHSTHLHNGGGLLVSLE